MSAIAARLHEMLRSCEICPRNCRVDRLAGELGYCGSGASAEIASVGPHFGEEPPLVGAGGSGTIFFTGCNLRCVFCQNYDISHLRHGRAVTAEQLASAMLGLQEAGCHNINWVTPTHQIAAIVEALELARGRGLRLPTVYNCGGYEKVETLRLLEGLVDIYMPDAKYLSPAAAERYSDAPDYPERMKESLREMHRQVGDLEIVAGIATRGLLVRHLVMPNALEDSRQVLDFLAKEISPHTYVNVMDQYHPCFRADHFPEISHRTTRQEYQAAVAHARKLGLRLAE